MHVYLSKEESRELVERGSKIINGRAKVIVQTSALLVEEVVDRTRHAAECGADGVMVVPPFFEGPTDEEDIFAFYGEASKGGLPIVGYNVPHAVGVEITPSLLSKLSEIPNFCTAKDSSGNLGKQSSLIRTRLLVMNGADPLVSYALFAGAAGLMWGGASIAPKSCVAPLPGEDFSLRGRRRGNGRHVGSRDPASRPARSSSCRSLRRAYRIS